MTLVKAYAKRMWKDLSSVTTWQPDVQLSVGDIVTAGPGGKVTVETNLAALGVGSSELPSTDSVATPLHTWDGVSFNADAGANVGAYGKAKAAFSGTSSFLIVTEEGVVEQVAHMKSARDLMTRLNTAGDWQSSWHLVTTVRRYPATTIVISKSGGVHVDLDVDVSAIADGIPNGIKAGAGVSVDNESVSQWVMSFDSTPLFEVMRMKKRTLFNGLSPEQVEYLTRDLDESEYADAAAADGVEIEQIDVPQMATAIDFGLF